MTHELLLSILRNIYIHSIVPLIIQKMYKYCFMMSWEEQLIHILPTILKNLSPDEIDKEIISSLTCYTQKYSLKKMLLSSPFCIRTFILICRTDMNTDLRWQTRIAQAVHKTNCISEEKEEMFGKRYFYTAIKNKINRPSSTCFLK